MTSLRLIRALPLPEPGTVTAVGVDDFAFRICRDRAGGYAKGIGHTAICRALNLDDKTVRRYARAASAEELLAQALRRASVLDEHTAYLAERWQEGCTNARLLFGELRERGYRGGKRQVRRLLHTWRESSTPPTATPITTPKPRQVTGWIIRPTHKRTEPEQADLAQILDRCPVLRTVDELVSDFGGILRHRCGKHLDAWIAAAQASEISQLQGFAAGPLKDYDAVRNGLILPWSSGAAEGTVDISSLRSPLKPRVCSLVPREPHRYSTIRIASSGHQAAPRFASSTC